MLFHRQRFSICIDFLQAKTGFAWCLLTILQTLWLHLMLLLFNQNHRSKDLRNSWYVTYVAIDWLSIMWQSNHKLGYCITIILCFFLAQSVERFVWASKWKIHVVELLLIGVTFVRKMLRKVRERTKKQNGENHQERNASHVKSTIKVLLFDVLNFFFSSTKNKKKKRHSCVNVPISFHQCFSMVNGEMRATWNIYETWNGHILPVVSLCLYIS